MSSLKASISQVDSSLPVCVRTPACVQWTGRQELVIAIENAPSLGVMMLAVKLVEEVLTERAQRKTKWPICEKCGTRLESKGFVERQLTCLPCSAQAGLIGTVRWERRVGRCPNGCKIGQVAPLDAELGLEPNQCTGADLKRAACSLAVFVPFEVAAVSLKLLTEVVVSPGAIWDWVQEAGREAMTRLQHQLEALEEGEVPGEEKIEAIVASLPLLMGADGVMVPFRPNDGRPNGRTIWREVKVGVLARLSCWMSRTGKPVSQLIQRRLVAVLGSVDDLEPRLPACAEGRQVA